jgi:hypothetical protein
MIEPLRRRTPSVFLAQAVAAMVAFMPVLALAQSFVSTGLTLDEEKILARELGTTLENLVAKSVSIDQVVREASPSVAPLPEWPSYPEKFQSFIVEANRGGRVIKFFDTYVAMPGRPAGLEFGYAIIRNGQAVAIIESRKHRSNSPD